MLSFVLKLLSIKDLRITSSQTDLPLRMASGLRGHFEVQNAKMPPGMILHLRKLHNLKTDDKFSSRGLNNLTLVKFKASLGPGNEVTFSSLLADFRRLGFEDWFSFVKNL